MLLPPNDPIYNPGYKYVYGLNLEFKALVNIAIKPGQCRDSSNVNDIFVESELLLWGDRVGPNALDSGVLEPLKLYKVFVIGDSKKYNPSAGLLSLLDEPLLPQGYDMYRRVGYVPTGSNASPNVQFREWYQSGASENKTYYFANAVLVGAALGAGGYVDLPIDLGITTDVGQIACPNTASQAIVQGFFNPGDNVYLLPYDPDLLTSPSTGSVHFKHGAAGGTASAYTFFVPVGAKPNVNPLLPSAATIKYRGGMALLYVSGFVDELY